MEVWQEMVYAVWRLALMWLGLGLQAIGLGTVLVGGWSLGRRIRENRRLAGRAQVLNNWKASLS